MRYTHSLRVIRKRKHTGKISIIMSLILVIMIFFVGFTTLDARQFFLGFLESLIRVTISYFIALFIALTLAFLVTISPTVENISVPILDVLQSFPSFALYPLFVLWFGKSGFVTILILLAEMIWPILFTLLGARKQIRQDLLEAGKAFGATGFNYYRYIIFPLILPAVVTGSIVAWGEAWEAIIAAEIIVNISGVGTYLAQNGSASNSKILLIGILLLLSLLFVLNKYIWLPLLSMSTRYQQES